MDAKRLLLHILVALLPLACLGQNVSISPESGYLLMANTENLDYDEGGAPYGFCSLWRHKQLPLAMIVADYGDLTHGGELAKPAGNLNVDRQSADGTSVGLTTGTERLLVHAGSTNDCFISLSLPKGYHFTGYRLAMLNNVNGKTIRTKKIGEQTKQVFETGASFETSSAAAQSDAMGTTNETKEYVIERTSMQGGADMGNHLYFRVTHSNTSSFFGFTIKSFVIYFTPEGGTDIIVAPVSVDATGSNHRFSPFETGRAAVGELTPYTPSNYRSETYWAYMAENMHSMVADNVVYQEDAATAGALVPATGNITACWNKSRYRYGMKNGTYYVETPTHARNAQDGTLPLGLRITGAKVHYTYGEAVTSGTDNDRALIQYTADGVTRYLDIEGHFTTERSEAETWLRGTATGSGTTTLYSEHVDDDGSTTRTYLSSHRVDGVQYLRTTDIADEATEFATDTEGRVYASSGYTRYYIVGTSEATAQPQLSRGTSSGWWNPTYTPPANAATRTGTFVAAFTPTDYTLTVCDKDGNDLTTVNVGSGTEDNFVELTGLNNDAIKFKVSGLTGTEARALVYVTLTVEALNPYINRTRIVCSNPAMASSQEPGVHDHTQVAQVFTADDFKVKGGKFKFYVPDTFYAGAQSQGLAFSFENLFSRYGDETYPEGSAEHHSRYYYIQSAYDQAAHPDATKPASDKISTTQCGTQMFVANNMADLQQAGSTSGSRTFTEYPFSMAKYQEQNGTFSQLFLTDKQEATRMLVTADEPRYNIGLLTATPHRSHAYYEMDIELAVKTYQPVATWTKIWDATFYDGGNAGYARSSKWGLEFNVTDPDIQPGEGYVTLYDVEQLLATEIGTEGCPASQKDIMYVDFSKVANILYTRANTGEENHMVRFRNTLATNALIFLPADASSPGDNFCCKKADGDFRATNDIVLTDKQPFYTPYNIQLSSENYARYTRLISAAKNGKVSRATIIMPFTIEVNSDSEHKNSDGTAFRLYSMQQTNCLSVTEADASTCNNYFSGMTRSGLRGNTSAANCPYMLEVTHAPEEADRSFVLEQRGALVVRTPHTSATDYAVTGETASGTFGAESLSLTALATYSGQELPCSTGTYFYFGKDMLLNSQYIRDTNPSVKVLPFRTYYATSQSAAARAIRQMAVVFGENTAQTPTGIGSAQTAAAYSVSSSEGGITVTAETACRVRVTTVAGTAAAALSLKAGETRTLALPSGIYVVGGRKVAVSK